MPQTDVAVARHAGAPVEVKIHETWQAIFSTRTDLPDLTTTPRRRPTGLLERIHASSGSGAE